MFKHKVFKRKKEIEIKKNKLGDIDNYLKFILDALVKSRIIEDDRQILETSIKYKDKPQNSLIINLYEIVPHCFSCNSILDHSLMCFSCNTKHYIK